MSLGAKYSKLGDSYNTDLFTYLKAFLGAYFNHDWGVHFPPSTIKFMINFNPKNVTEIEEERLRIDGQKKAEHEAGTGEGKTSKEPIGKGDSVASSTETQSP